VGHQNRSAIGRAKLEGATAVVNLTGRSVDCRYNAKNRREIMDSRVNSTRVVGEAIAQCKTPRASGSILVRPHFISTHSASRTTSRVRTWIRVDARMRSRLRSRRLGANLERSENAYDAQRSHYGLSMVLGLGRNSVFPVLRRLTKFGLGGRQGSGKQFVSWIHVEDFCRAIEWIIAHEDLVGPINQCAPNPLQTRR